MVFKRFTAPLVGEIGERADLLAAEVTGRADHLTEKLDEAIDLLCVCLLMATALAGAAFVISVVTEARAAARAA